MWRRMRNARIRRPEIWLVCQRSVATADGCRTLRCTCRLRIPCSLLLSRQLILDSTVVRGIPSLRTVPDGPESRLRLASRASVIIFPLDSRIHFAWCWL